MNKPTNEQITVVETENKVISLKAPGGTGKTETLAWFVFNRMEDRRIVLVTYTNSAAQTMENRLRKSVNFKEHTHIVSTMHSFSNRILHKHADKIGYKDYKLEPGITEKLIKELERDNPQLGFLKKPVKTLLRINEKFQRSDRTIANIAAEYNIRDNNQVSLIGNILIKLLKEKKQLNVMDFDDLTYYFYILLKNHTSIVQSIVRDYPLMIVDEFQDTSDIQWNAMKLLIDSGIRFLGAGDPYQTLYRFAGASTTRFQQLEAIPQCAAFQLIQNHRSTNQIISLSNAIRATYLNNYKFKTRSEKTGSLPQVIVNHEKGLLIRAILEKISIHLDEGISIDDMAVTYRFNKDANYLRRALQTEKVPYIIFDDKDNKSKFAEFVLSVIKISQDQGESKHWRKILYFISGVGTKKIEQILYHLEKVNYKYEGIKNVPKRSYKEDLIKLQDLFINTTASMDNPLEALHAIIGFYSGLEKTRRPKENDPHLATMLNIARVSKDLQDFISKYIDPSYGEYHPFSGETSKGFLTLSTIHKIKGKGFKVVFIMGAYDGIYKGLGTFDDMEDIKDEVMIMDTAVTRSKCYLYFLFPMTHKKWKQKDRILNPSIFIRECSAELYDVFTVSYKRD